MQFDWRGAEGACVGFVIANVVTCVVFILVAGCEDTAGHGGAASSSTTSGSVSTFGTADDRDPSAAADSGNPSTSRPNQTADGATDSDGALPPAAANLTEAGDAGAGLNGAGLNDAAANAESRNAASGEILTQRYDNARSGANLAENVLTPARARDLTLLGRWIVDGQVYAQVLVASDVPVAGVRRNIAIVATMNNSVFAFDVDRESSEALLWHRGGMGELGTPLLSARNIGGPNGILSTPVIDPAKRWLYVVARDCDPSAPPETPKCQHRLFQLDLANGDIQRSPPIRGEVSVADGDNTSPVTFNPSVHWNRPALLLVGDHLVIAFGAGPAGTQHEEDFVYHGWVFRYDVRDLDLAPDVYCTTPRGRGGSVWQSGAGPAADEHGIFITGANGIQADGVTHPPADWPKGPVGQEDSVVRLPRLERFPTPAESPAQYSDTRAYLAAGNVFQHMESGDNGFGSTTPTLIPETRALLVGTKSGLVYLLDRETLAPLQEPLSPFTLQPLQPQHSLYLHGWSGIPMITQAFVFWRVAAPDSGARYGYAYAWASNDVLRSFRYDYANGKLELFATAEVPALAGGGSLVLSALGGVRESGILWATTRAPSNAAPAGQVWAFDPITLDVLWRIDTPAYAKFNPPTVVRGKIFVPSTAPQNPDRQQVLIYGVSPH